MPGRVDGLSAPEGPQRTRQNESRRTSDNTRSSENTASANEADRVELSTAAQDTRQLESKLQNAASDIPDVREHRVAQVRARIASGEYENENVRRIIADRILSQLGIE